MQSFMLSSSSLLLRQIRTFLQLLPTNMSSADSVNWREVKELKGMGKVLLVDVREPYELEETGVIPDSINIPLNTLEDTLKELSAQEFFSKYGREKPDSNTLIVFHCRSGNRSAKAQSIALNLGFINVKNYKGGWSDWEKHLEESE